MPVRALTVSCPVDGRDLTLQLPEARVPPAKDIGEHAHLVFTGTASCAGGHRWRVEGDILIEREA